MDFQNLKYTKDGGIGIITASRPKAMNALNTDLLVELGKAADMVAEDKELKVLVITGEGKAFVAGADIVEMKDFNSEQGREWGELGSTVFNKIEKLKIPSIAAVNGFALGGGCELAMCCDIRIASENAKFGQPEVGLGITPGYSGCVRLPRLVGPAKAKELIYTADIIPAAEAERIGLVNKVVPSEQLMDATMAMAKKIASRAQIAVRYSKMAINRGLETDIETAIVFENQVFALCFATDDQKEGMTAFIEKRDADFKCK
ncbi:MAG TPA: enoyl-CoA hydratase-related protein [Spirochaetota bacterium]|nr:enoyl-CoA hydratase-related protein [Spirochaetota bacterium]